MATKTTEVKFRGKDENLSAVLAKISSNLQKTNTRLLQTLGALQSLFTSDEGSAKILNSLKSISKEMDKVSKKADSTKARVKGLFESDSSVKMLDATFKKIVSSGSTSNIDQLKQIQGVVQGKANSLYESIQGRFASGEEISPSDFRDYEKYQAKADAYYRKIQALESKASSQKQSDFNKEYQNELYLEKQSIKKFNKEFNNELYLEAQAKKKFEREYSEELKKESLKEKQFKYDFNREVQLEKETSKRIAIEEQNINKQMAMMSRIEQARIASAYKAAAIQEKSDSKRISEEESNIKKQMAMVEKINRARTKSAFTDQEKEIKAQQQAIEAEAKAKQIKFEKDYKYELMLEKKSKEKFEKDFQYELMLEKKAKEKFEKDFSYELMLEKKEKEKFEKEFNNELKLEAKEKSRLASEEAATKKRIAVEESAIKKQIALMDRLNIARKRNDVAAAIQASKSLAATTASFYKNPVAAENFTIANKQISSGSIPPVSSATSSSGSSSLLSGIFGGGVSGGIIKLMSRFLVVSAAVRVATMQMQAAFNALYGTVEEFNVNVAKTTATLLNFKTLTTDKEIAEGYKEARGYAEELYYYLERVSTQTVATADELSAMNDELIRQRVILNLNDKETEQSFKNIANAVSIISANYPDKVKQIQQEIRAVLSGQLRPNDQLARTLNALTGGNLKNLLTQWKSQGGDTLVKEVGKLLSGFGEVSKDLEKSGIIVFTNFSTIIKSIVRNSFSGIYEYINSIMIKINDSLKKNSGTISDSFKKTFLFVIGIVDSLNTSLKLLGLTIGTVASSINTLSFGKIGEGLSALGYTIAVEMPLWFKDWENTFLDTLDVMAYGWEKTKEKFALTDESKQQYRSNAESVMKGLIERYKEQGVTAEFDERFGSNIALVARTLGIKSWDLNRDKYIDEWVNGRPKGDGTSTVSVSDAIMEFSENLKEETSMVEKQFDKINKLVELKYNEREMILEESYKRMLVSESDYYKQKLEISKSRIEEELKYVESRSSKINDVLIDKFSKLKVNTLSGEQMANYISGVTAETRNIPEGPFKQTVDKYLESLKGLRRNIQAKDLVSVIGLSKASEENLQETNIKTGELKLKLKSFNESETTRGVLKDQQIQKLNEEYAINERLYKLEKEKQAFAKKPVAEGIDAQRSLFEQNKKFALEQNDIEKERLIGSKRLVQDAVGRYQIDLQIKELARARLDILSEEFDLTKATADETERLRGIREAELNSLLSAIDAQAQLAVMSGDYNTYYDKQIESLNAQLGATTESGSVEQQNLILKQKERIKAVKAGGIDALEYGMRDVYNSWKDYGTEMVEFGTTVASSLSDAFESGFFDIMQGKFEGLKGLLYNFVSSVQQALAKMLATKVATGILSMFVGHEGGVVPRMHDGGMVKRYHSGGTIKPTVNFNSLSSGEVPAILQSGEGVLSRKGMENLGRLNGDGISDESIDKLANKLNNSIMIVNSVDESVMENWARSMRGRRVIQNVIGG